MNHRMRIPYAVRNLDDVGPLGNATTISNHLNRDAIDGLLQQLCANGRRNRGGEKWSTVDGSLEQGRNSCLRDTHSLIARESQRSREMLRVIIYVYCLGGQPFTCRLHPHVFNGRPNRQRRRSVFVIEETLRAF